MKEIDIKYNLREEEVFSGLYIIQKYFAYKKKKIQTIILAIISIGFIFIKIPNDVNIFLFYLGFLSIFLIWYTMHTKIKRISKGISMVEDEFFISVEKIGIGIGEGKYKKTLSYSDKNLFIFLDIEKFVISNNKEEIFIIPKRCISKLQEEDLKNIFNNKIKDRFIKF